MLDVSTDCTSQSASSILAERPEFQVAVAPASGGESTGQPNCAREEGDASKDPDQKLDHGRHDESYWKFGSRLRTKPSRRVDIVYASTRGNEPDVDLIAQAVLAITADLARIVRGAGPEEQNGIQ